MDSQTFRPTRRLLVAVGIAAGLVAAPLSAPLAATAAASTDGIWQTDGYGTIVAVDNGKAQLYETTSISCTPAAVYTQDGDRFTAEEQQPFTLRIRRDRAVMHAEGNVGDKQLRRLTKLPRNCTVPGATGPLAVFDQFWTTFDENYPFFGAKGIDWNAARAQYRPLVKPGMSDDALLELLGAMIKPLGDAHTAIRTPDGEMFQGVRPGTTFPDEHLEAKIRPYIEDVALKGVKFTSYANNRIGYAELPGGIGYLRVISFFGYRNDFPDYAVDRAALDRALDTILAKKPRKLIVDLRLNGGGSDQLGLDLASRLTDRPYFAYFKRARNDPRNPSAFTAPQPLFVQPGTAQLVLRSDGPADGWFADECRRDLHPGDDEPDAQAGPDRREHPGRLLRRPPADPPQRLAVHRPQRGIPDPHLEVLRRPRHPARPPPPRLHPHPPRHPPGPRLHRSHQVGTLGSGVMARYFDVHPENPQKRAIGQVVDLVREGGLIAYPTDSCFALGCQLGNREGIDRIRAIRHLDDRHHFTLVCQDFAQLGQFVHISNAVFRSIKAATPGSYTFILPATKEVPRRLLHPKKKTVGVRIPDHVVARALVEELGEPLLSSTLLLPDEEEPMTQGWEIKELLDHQVDAVIDSGDCGTEPTTVIDFSEDFPEIVRRGAGDPTPFE